MTVMRLKGLNSATKRLSDGRLVTYWYAWRGGPRLDGRPGSAEFVASYHRATQSRKRPAAGVLADLVALYKGSPEWEKHAASTKREWSRWLDEIAKLKGTHALGGIPIAALNDPNIGGDFQDWRDQWADRPRSADYAVQVLSALLGWAKRRRKIAINAAEGIEDLYEANRADQIWTDDELALAVMAADSTEVAFIIVLACLTGFRREDLALLSWDHVGDVAIVVPTGKSRGKKAAVVPILIETRQLLDKIEAHQKRLYEGKRCATVLVNTRGDAWTPSGLSHAVLDCRRPFGITKRLHDARGTFATRLRLAGLTASEIADVVAWEEERVKRLLATYVDRDAIVRNLAERIARSEG